MSGLKDIIGRLYPFPYSVTGKGNDESLPVWQEEVPFKVHEFSSGSVKNGWRIPLAWYVEKARIKKGSKLIYDGTISPLGVIAQSESFVGEISFEKLKKHLFYSDKYPSATVYHWSNLYRQEEKGWGFCIPKNLYEALEHSDYYVELVCGTKPGTMKVLDFELKGESSETILLNGHNCHPFQANDDLSGCVVGIDIMKHLLQIPKRRFTYRLLIAPELIGPVFWLASPAVDSKNLIYTIMLKSVGNEAPLRLQESYSGLSQIDKAAHYVFNKRYQSYDSGPFRTIYGNDETVFEAPGYEIPSVSVTRFPFDEYHTDQDTPDKLSESSLLDTRDCVLEIIMALEKNIVLEVVQKGLICLSSYGLYKPAPAPGIDKSEYTQELRNWNLLMNNFPRDLNGKTSLLEIAVHYNVSLEDLYDYAMNWVEKGLARVVNGSGKH